LKDAARRCWLPSGREFSTGTKLSGRLRGDHDKVAAVRGRVVAELPWPRLAEFEGVTGGQLMDIGPVREDEQARQHPDELRDERVRPAGYGTRAPAGQVAIGDVRAGLLPQDKVSAVSDLQARGGRVLLVGDGIVQT
jgi:hypothetical protein